jgi:lipopolysaccharide heptosyltransferase II
MSTRAPRRGVTEPARILVVAPNWIGDALMAQPLLARLREKRPAVRIDVLAPDWVAPVLRRMPGVDEVVAAPLRHGALQLRERWRLGRMLRPRGYDQAIVLPNAWKAALVPFFADIPLRSGYVGESRFGLLNLLYRSARGREPMTLHYARLSEPPGSEPAQPLPAPRLALDAGAARATARRFGIEGRYAVFCPGAEYGPAKRWPYFAELAARMPLPVVLLGSARDREACAGVRGLDLAGRTSLDEALELIACAELVVSNDSGLMHVAAALGRPQVALFGSSSPEHTPPLSAGARVVWLHIDCSPCFERVCPLGHFRCMKDLSVERVLDEVGSLGVLTSPAA